MIRLAHIAIFIHVLFSSLSNVPDGILAEDVQEAILLAN